MSKLTKNGATRHTLADSRTLGFLQRGSNATTDVVVSRLPADLAGAEESVCGLKAFLIDERRAFANGDQESVIDCARVAVLDITDSPVHVHGETVETYQILSGEGQMVLGPEVRPVSSGDFILLPPGLPHGLVSTDPEKPVRVLMTFSPGMAPVAAEQFRDEKILFPSTKDYLRESYPDS
ncbi:MAG: cupin domain-containing protein [Opitutales bacterium]|nr:cupin domain-containing protein [Opitutales bacterium]MCH8541434.1 cupin domain-containing protein [Opitutales bacterium]